jgi:hypothetical protein
MSISLIVILVLLFGCSNINYKGHSVKLIGEWYGKIPETSALLILETEGSGSLNFIDFKKKYNFRYWVTKDSILNFESNSITDQYIFKLSNNKLFFLPIEKNKGSIDLICEVEFVKR